MAKLVMNEFLNLNEPFCWKRNRFYDDFGITEFGYELNAKWAICNIQIQNDLFANIQMLPKTMPYNLYTLYSGYWRRGESSRLEFEIENPAIGLDWKI